MGLFSAIIKTTIETAKLPLAIVADVVTLGNFGEGTHTGKQLDNIKKASED
jgi:hypothetical protein